MKLRAIGIMSGTSADGIDAVLLELDSAHRPSWPRIVDHAYVAYPKPIQAQLMRPQELIAQSVTRMHYRLAELYAQAAQRLAGWESADVVGLHGQTIVHEVGPAAVEDACTLQIGSSAVVAARLRLPVVGDIRAADVAAGGLGAPLVPFAHWFFLRGRDEVAAVVNFGGICNVTVAPEALHDVRGSDVGPGMMLSDAFAQRSSDGRLSYDEGGQQSAGGQRIEPLFADVLQHPFVQGALPKSCGREEFGSRFSDTLWRHVASHSASDVAFTLLDATASILADAFARAPFAGHRFDAVYLTGGGAKNPTLVQLCRDHLAKALPHACVRVVEDGPLAPQHHEPAAMALIALRTLHALPSSLPAVTGAAHPCVLGHIHAPPASAPSST